MVEEAAQVPPLDGLEAPRDAQQLVDVGEPPLPPFQTQHVIGVAGCRQGPLDQLAGRAPPRSRPLCAEQRCGARDRREVLLAEFVRLLSEARAQRLDRLPEAARLVRRTGEQAEPVE